MNSNAVSDVPACVCGQLEEAAARRRGRGSATSAIGALGGHREQLERRRRDDAERAFRPDEEIAQVVARVVLLERA